MSHFQTDIYLIHCLTPLHAGSGETNYGEIDKLVQRDPTNHLPTIYSSALKGAIREFCEEFCKEENKPDMIAIFGGKGLDEKPEKEETPPKKEDSGKPAKQSSKPGKCRFFSADLLCLPVQGLKNPYFLTTSASVLAEMNQKMEALGAAKDALNSAKISQEIAVLTAEMQNAGTSAAKKEEIEEDIKALEKNKQELELFQWNTAVSADAEDLNYEIKGKKLTTSCLAGSEVYLVSEDDFCQNIAKNLPVIARNHLDNGESKNLWYEEIVPRESRFVFAVAAPTKEASLLQTLKEYINGTTIHIGAHASIGYGYCKITKLN